jgi:hypothetical protein
MIFTVFLFNILFCSALIYFYIQNPPKTDDICGENKLYYKHALKHLLYIYILLFIVCMLLNFVIKSINPNTFTNIALLSFGFITLFASIIISINIYPQKIQCLVTSLSYYLSLLPLIIFGIMSIFLGYLGSICTRIN